MSSLTGRLFDHYRILERIGRGGMATVYHADDRKSGRDVAIKFISPALAETEDFLKRFRREVRLIAGLNHPNIVSVYDYGEQEGYAYLVMPYLPRGSLTDRMRRDSVSMEEGGKLLDQVASALDYAHRHGIIHRDVKPSNILLDDQGNALLGDFGLARSHESTLSLTGSALIGTPAYLAPEAVRGEKIGPACDQYSLGVILFQLATGTLPFDASTPMALVLKHVSEPFPAARSRNPKVPESIERVIIRATAKDPNARFASVSEMNWALQAALNYARDPTAYRAPTIELPRAAALSPAAGASVRPVRNRRSVRVAAIGTAVLLMVLAAPVFASGLLGLLERAASPAAGDGSDLGSPNSGELTARAATFEAMATQLAGSAGRELRPGEIETAIMETLAAMNGSGSTLVGPAITPAPFAFSSGSETASPGVPVSTATAAGTQLPGPGPASPLPGTPTPASSSTSAPSATAPPTHTPAPSSTPIPTPPTATPSPKPPEPTATQDTCSLLSLGGFSVGGTDVVWVFTNDSSTPVTITRIVLDWPPANVRLDRIRFDGSSIWNGADDSPPSDVEPGIGNRTLGAGSSKGLRFQFEADVQATGYQVQVHMNLGCELSAGG
jgi:hypothetical protein